MLSILASRRIAATALERIWLQNHESQHLGRAGSETLKNGAQKSHYYWENSGLCTGCPSGHLGLVYEPT
jgi:hypothetical protein